MRVVLNAAPLTFGSDTVPIGYLPDEGKEAYQVLRDGHRSTHVFRFDQRVGQIANLGLNGAAPLGAVLPQPVEENLFLCGLAVQRHIVAWLARRYTVLQDHNPVVFWAAAKRHRLLSRAVREHAAQRRDPPDVVDGVDVFVRFRLGTKLLFPRGNQPTPYLGLLVDLHTSNVIDLSVADLIDRGLDPRGLYVGQRAPDEDDFLLPGLSTLGRVREVRGGVLVLDDLRAAPEGEPPVDRVFAAEALVNPRNETLDSVIRLLYGSHADAIADRLRHLRRSYAVATEQLQHVSNTLQGLRDNVAIEAGGASVEIGPLLQRGDALFPLMISTSRPTCLFGPQGRKTGQVPDTGVTTFGPFQYMFHEKNEPLIAVVCEAAKRARVEQFLGELRDGFPDSEWEEATKNRHVKRDNPYTGGLLGKYRLRRVRYEIEEVPDGRPASYRSGIRRLLDRLPRIPDLGVVQTLLEYRDLKGNDNPYLVAKAEFMSQGVPVQAITTEKIEAYATQIPFILNGVALASYAKMGGTPWVLSTRNPGNREVVIGIGYTESSDSQMSPRKRFVGLTTFFQGNGRYITWGKTGEVPYEEYAAALLRSLRTTVRYVEANNEWEPGDRVRLVFHVYKPLKHVEIEAVKNLVAELIQDRYEVEFAFLNLSSFHDYALYDRDQTGVDYYPLDRRGKVKKGVGVPERGLCFQLDPRRALVQLVGPRELKTDLDGAPRPLLVEVHPHSDVDDLTYLVRQVFHFSFLSWRSFHPASEPVTILYSEWIARKLAQLHAIEGWDSRAVTIGPLATSKWFL